MPGVKMMTLGRFESAKESSEKKVFRSGLVECCVRHDGTRAERNIELLKKATDSALVAQQCLPLQSNGVVERLESKRYYHCHLSPDAMLADICFNKPQMVK
ncbi:hypothetical protein KC342_g112 [Hortaea werneckii]|nr:hypothetical protein KC342_g112 [Hortaea werneckii]